jgi:periplasmic divalent cation tolerance protein
MTQNLNRYGVVLVTAGSKTEAEAIAHSLIQARFAACVSLMPIQSVYTWQDKVHQEEEWQLMIKTDLSQFADLETKIREIHSYEVPEIIALPILAGSQPYLDWISEQTQSAKEG